MPTPEIDKHHSSVNQLGDIGATQMVGTGAYKGIKLSIYHTLKQRKGAGIMVHGDIGLEKYVSLNIDLETHRLTYQIPSHGLARTVPA